MTSPWVSVAELAEATSIWRPNLRRRAAREEWHRRTVEGNGGPQFLYRLRDLPEDIQAAWARHHGRGCNESAQASEPVAVRADKPGPIMDRIPERHRTVAYARSSLIDEYKCSGLRVEGFLAAYHAGRIGTAHRDVVGDVSVKTFYRYVKAFADHGLEGLAPKYSSNGPNPGRSMSEEEKTRAAALWLTQNKWSIAKVQRAMADNYKMVVGYHSLRRYLQSLPPALVTYLRDGPSAYRNRFEPYLEEDYTRFESMEWIVGDHHMFDVAVTDGKRVFRPWLTVFVDKRSRMPVGWDVNDGPDSLTILKALEMAVKEYGAPAHVLIDNGKDYRAQLLNGRDEWVDVETQGLHQRTCVTIQGVFAALQCETHFATPYRAQSKGGLERWFGTLARDFCKEFETYLGSNTTERPEVSQLYYRRLAKMKKREVLVHFDDFRGAVDAYIEYWTNHRKHTGQGMGARTPSEVFHGNWRTRRVVPERYRVLLFTRTEVRAVGRQGVRLDNITYYGGDELFEYKGLKVEVRRGFEDLSKVWVHDLDGRFICEAHCSDHRATGLTERDLKRVRASRKKENAALRKLSEPIAKLQSDTRGVVDIALEQRGQAIAHEVPKQEYRVVNGNIELPPGSDEHGDAAGGDVIEFPRPAGERVKRRALKGLLDPD